MKWCKRCHTQIKPNELAFNGKHQDCKTRPVRKATGLYSQRMRDIFKR